MTDAQRQRRENLRAHRRAAGCASAADAAWLPAETRDLALGGAGPERSLLLRAARPARPSRFITSFRRGGPRERQQAHHGAQPPAVRAPPRADGHRADARPVGRHRHAPRTGIDLEHDHALRAAGAMIACDRRVSWGERGVVHRRFDPLTPWQAPCAARVNGGVRAAGHFIPDERPVGVAGHLLRHCG